MTITTKKEAKGEDETVWHSAGVVSWPWPVI